MAAGGLTAGPRFCPTDQEYAIYPVLFRIGEFEITSFGVLVAVAALVGLWLFERERRRSGLPDQALDAATAGVFDGLAGAKIVWAIEHVGREGPFLDLLFSRGGLRCSADSALVAGWPAGDAPSSAVGCRFYVLAAATPALVLARGRVGSVASLSATTAGAG